MRLLGNTVLIQRLADTNEQVSAGGIICVNHHRKTNLKFRVLAIGPGEQRRRMSRSGKLKTTAVFDKPQVEVGDCIITRAEMDDGIVKHSLDDGTGRLIIKSEGILASWKD
jgi:co-chaperonin GroES (HSP10)